ncbi:hypothetical protein CHARACLAT_009774, partial [Characodon lateralis]|nr:hypothetical protein [Characodon lateralis]
FIMLVKVRFGEMQKYVKVAETEDGYDFNTFLQEVVLQHDLSSASLESTMSDNSSLAVSGDSLLASTDSSDEHMLNGKWQKRW